MMGIAFFDRGSYNANDLRLYEFAAMNPILILLIASLSSLILCGVRVLYGCRLGLFLYRREKKSAAYRNLIHEISPQAKRPLWEILMVWVFCALLYVAEVSPVFFRARRLELRQSKVYGDNPEYQKYVKSTPILIPFIPLYSVVKYKFLAA